MGNIRKSCLQIRVSSRSNKLAAKPIMLCWPLQNNGKQPGTRAKYSRQYSLLDVGLASEGKKDTHTDWKFLMGTGDLTTPRSHTLSDLILNHSIIVFMFFTKWYKLGKCKNIFELAFIFNIGISYFLSKTDWKFQHSLNFSLVFILFYSNR